MRYDDERLPLQHKLFVVVREDLSPGLRAAQAAHGVAEVVLNYPEKAWEWHQKGNFLIVLGSPDEVHLRAFYELVKQYKFPRQCFFEPDLNGQMTSFACIPPPQLNSLLAPLSLAYQPPKWKFWR